MTKRKVITKRSEFDFIRERMTKEDFYSKFEVSMKLTQELLAEDMFTYEAFTDELATAKRMTTFKKLESSKWS